MMSGDADHSTGTRSGFVAIVGRPNVGKSTLLNAMLGEKVAITADKPQTTRNRIRGILNEAGSSGGPDFQIIFLDTPGITKPRNKLGSYMANSAITSISDVDAILFVTDDPGRIAGGDRFILDMLLESDVPCLLVINKTDLMSPDDFKAAYEEWEKSGRFAGVYGTVASDGDGVAGLLAKIRELMPEGPQYFPAGIVTDMPERFIAAEIIREKLLNYLHEEVPHGIAVEIEDWDENVTPVGISAVIYTEKKSHKGIIIGKAGHTLKGVGKAARLEIESLLGLRVHLKLWVKVKENWREDDRMLGSLGYKD